MSQPLIAVIIAGGAGTRLWPISRELYPKPFLKLPDGQSLLQKTYQRARQLSLDGILLIINREIYFQTKEELIAVNPEQLPINYLLEPEGRNTAPAIIAAALYVQQHFQPDADLLVLPADHIIQDGQAFAQAVSEARALAAQRYIVTFGIKPHYPETGYGYIQLSANPQERFKVQRFVEKPSLAHAEAYLASGDYVWNSGMFCFRAEHLLAESAHYAPVLTTQVTQAMQTARETQHDSACVVELTAKAFKQAENISIDYALLEKSARIAVVSCDIGWNDIGSWNAFDNLTPADAEGNRREGQTLLHNSNNCYIQSQHRLTAAVGVDDLIIIDTPDALLVANRAHAQDVKKIAQQLKLQGHEAHKSHRTVYRPWGSYTVLEESPLFKIKRIEVKAGAALSLQMHHHRSEHWIVVSGTAKVTNGENLFLLNANQSTFIPSGHQHRLENPGKILLVLIEVQSGEYLGEDDIVRFEDNYGRIEATV